MRRPRINLSMAFAGLLLAALALFVVVVPLLPGYAPQAQDLGASLLPPGGESFDGTRYLLGTDPLGRDLMDRLALAGLVSIGIGLGAVAISLVIGVTLGLVAGFFRGWVETAIMGLADLQLSIPRVLLLIAVAAIIGPGAVKLAVLLGLTSWVSYGRVARAMALSLRAREFVQSATTQGATPAWNIRKHLLPNVLPQMWIVGSYELAQIIVMEASLSYLGLGVQPPLPSWGGMIAQGQTYLELQPSLILLPSLLLFMLVAGVQILSQAATSENESGHDLSRAKS